MGLCGLSTVSEIAQILHQNGFKVCYQLYVYALDYVKQNGDKITSGFFIDRRKKGRKSGLFLRTEECY